MLFPKKTLIDLEWDRLLQHWAARCSCEEAAERCLTAELRSQPAASAHLELVGEFLNCLEKGDMPPSLPSLPVKESLLRIRAGGSASGECLRHIAKNLKLYIAIAHFLDNRRDCCPRNASLVVPLEGNSKLIKLSSLAAEIESCFEPDGTVSDKASSELSKLRSRVITIRRRLTERLERIAERENDLLQERTIGVRNDRFVLMVRADAHRRLSGIVHGSSSTGATIFVEPEEIITAGNELTLAVEEIAREEARIIAALSEAVRFEIDSVEDACEITIDVETRIAAARLSVDIGAHVPLPAPSGEISLLRGRHPLLVLDGVNVVPCDVNLSPGCCMIISGPNAGGKTAVLKTVGLSALMTAAGLPIPASPDTRFGIPVSVLTDIGDDQSLKENLSTFSAHMTNISKILTAAGQGAIVLLDEIAAGTDPAEGAALAEALLEKLADMKASVMATTHFDALKTRALEAEGPFRNAAMGFDINSMNPTFTLHDGVPGSSSALEVAKRFGAPKEVIERAKSLMPIAGRRLEAAISAVESERVRMAEERRTLIDIRHQTEALEKQKMEELKKLKARENKFIDDEKQKLWSDIRKIREEISEAEKHLKRNRRDVVSVNKTKQTINQAADKLAVGGEFQKTDEETLPGRKAEPQLLVEGIPVFVIPFNKKGQISSPVRGKEVFVTIGGLKTRVNTSDLRILENNKTTTEKKTTLLSLTVGQRPDPIQTRENTVDLRGMTADEALDAADAFLDNMSKTDSQYAFIIHGHGTGVLRNAIRTYTATSPYVADSRPGEQGEGGDGVTVVWLV